jgi:peptidoglycan/xylan/chitin deacetylase (PgdA/CDA1 family)
MNSENGIFTISLDFELIWGMLGSGIEDTYEANILGVKKVIPELLRLFSKYEIHVTWGTVGFLFCENVDEINQNSPSLKPDYEDTKLSPYGVIKELKVKREDFFYCAPSLIKRIMNTPNQEIATHTFSHYYCIEKGQNIDSFREDLRAAIKVAGKFDVPLSSCIFPRNQVNKSYLSVCKELGIKAYRGPRKSWLYKPRKNHEEVFYRRGIRLMDAYINLSGHHCYSMEGMRMDPIYNIPSSQSLRPYSKKLKWFEKLKAKRICNNMKYAAQNKQIYHLCWHPHNFGINIEENLGFLENILIYYKKMKEKYGMESLNMKEIVEKLENRL